MKVARAILLVFSLPASSFAAQSRPNIIRTDDLGSAPTPSAKGILVFVRACDRQVTHGLGQRIILLRNPKAWDIKNAVGNLDEYQLPLMVSGADGAYRAGGINYDDVTA
jgi:hypothetical protein